VQRSLSFEVQRVCFWTKRYFPATNRAFSFALTNFGTHICSVPMKNGDCVCG